MILRLDGAAPQDLALATTFPQLDSNPVEQDGTKHQAAVTLSWRMTNGIYKTENYDDIIVMCITYSSPKKKMPELGKITTHA